MSNNTPIVIDEIDDDIFEVGNDTMRSTVIVVSDIFFDVEDDVDDLVYTVEAVVDERDTATPAITGTSYDSVDDELTIEYADFGKGQARVFVTATDTDDNSVTTSYFVTFYVAPSDLTVGTDHSWEDHSLLDTEPETDYSEADLRGVNLRGANLSSDGMGAFDLTFQGANLSDVDLSMSMSVGFKSGPTAPVIVSNSSAILTLMV